MSAEEVERIPVHSAVELDILGRSMTSLSDYDFKNKIVESLVRPGKQERGGKSADQPFPRSTDSQGFFCLFNQRRLEIVLILFAVNFQSACWVVVFLCVRQAPIGDFLIVALGILHADLDSRCGIITAAGVFTITCFLSLLLQG